MLRSAVLFALTLLISSHAAQARPASAASIASSERGRCANGLDDDDDKKVDCDDPDCASDAACLEARHCSDGLDNDGDGLVDCADDDCCDAAACVGAPGCPERPCDDRRDNDGDGPIDCADTDCARMPACDESIHCDNGLDDDLDGFVDCADLVDCCLDPSCVTAPGCELEDCTDGDDDDNDGLTDCDDPDCSWDCSERPGACQDGIDNDFDGTIDCADIGCDADPACSEHLHCSDGIDNDQDGVADCNDLVDCCADAACFTAPGCPERACTNGTDDDLDGRIDCLDPDCRSDPACRENLHCSDGIDNDVDGRIDCADHTACCDAASCLGAPGCPEGDCANGVDDDGDGVIDCEDSDCEHDPACTCVAGDVDNPDGFLALPLTECQTIDGITCESRAFYRVALDRGRTYTFTLCPMTCSGAGAGFDSGMALLGPAGGTVASNERTCDDDAEIRFTTDPLDGDGAHSLRITNSGGGGRRFTLGWFVDCVAPTTIVVSPPTGRSESADCMLDQLLAASIDGTGPFDWSWSIFPPGSGSASPSTGTARTNLGGLEFRSSLSGVGEFTMIVEASNACGSTFATHVLTVLDRAAPDAMAIATPDLNCGGPAPAPPPVAVAPIAPAPAGQTRAASVLSCPSPCDTGVLAQAGDFFDVFLRCDDGAFTARTGAFHPATLAAGAPRDVLYGGAAGRPGTSEIAFRVHDVAGTWSNPRGGAACAFDPPDTEREPQSAGLAEEWTIEPRPGVILHLREEIVTFGTYSSDAGVRLTLSATNDAASTAAAAIGLRWLLDHQSGADDGPTMATLWCDPTTVGPPRVAEHEFLAAEIGAQASLVNDDGGALVPVTLSTSHLNGFDDTRTPDRLMYAGWERARLSPWDHAALEGDVGPASDSAVMAWFGATTATSLTIAPGESASRSVILASDSAVMSCNRVRAGVSTDAVATICERECADVGGSGLDTCGAVSVRLVSSSPGAPPCAAPGCSAVFPAPGSYDYEWEIVDDAGHATLCRSTIIVLDEADPSCNQPPSCSITAPAAGTCRSVVVDSASALDPDADDLTWSWTSSRPDVAIIPASGLLLGAPGALGLPAVEARLDPGVSPCGVTATLTLTVSDGRAPASSCTTTVSFDDIAPPSLLGLPANARVACDAVPGPARVTATDACDAAPGLAFSERRVDGPCAHAWTLLRTWTATDACANAASSTQQIDVVDEVAPTLLGVPANARVACNAVPGPASVTATDACDAAPGLAFSERRVDGPCADSWTILRTWTATDACANAATYTQQIDVVDEVAPTLLGVPADIVADCAAVPAPAPVTATDACDPVPAVSLRESIVPGACPGRYTLLRDWSATDRCGNVASARQTITVVDVTPPTITPDEGIVACLWPANHRMACFGQDTFSPVIEDDCSEPVTWRLAGCVSDQPDDGRGDGHTENDCVVSPDGASICVRAERSGTEPLGRHYRVAIIATDACGNSSEPVVVGRIEVPHDRARRDDCVRADR